MWQVIALLYVIVGLGILVAVARRPSLFWPMLIIAAVFSAGLMVKEYTFIDEGFVGCVLIAGIMAISIRAIRVRNKQENIWEHLHEWIFYLMTIYLVVESIRGMLWWEDFGKMRWVVFFAMLGILAFMMAKGDFPRLKRKAMLLIIAGSILAYFIIYLASGLIIENVLGGSRWSAQTIEWPSTAYAFFPLIIGMPAAIMLLSERNRSLRWIGWAVILLSIICAFYYQSRVSLIYMLILSPFLLFKLNIRRVVLLITVILIIFGLFMGAGYNKKFTDQIVFFRYDLSRTIEGLRNWDTNQADIDRKVHLEAGFSSIKDNWESLFFGYGYRTHGVMIGPQLRTLWESKGFPEVAKGVAYDTSTEGFTAFLVDTGLIGMLLLIMNFLLVGRRILMQKTNRNRPIFLIALAFAFLWIFVINMLDIVLFYLLIMPSGLLLQLCNYETKEQAIVVEMQDDPILIHRRL